MSPSFYEPAGPGAFIATNATAGPWTPDAQHGGPPSALAAREIELHEAQEHMRLARVAVDILRPVPLGLLTLRTRTLRPGKRIALIETVMESAGQEVLCARGWRIAMPDAVPVITREVDVPEIPEHSVREAFRGAYLHGYLAQIDWRFVSGTFTEPGPCKAWGRPRIPLLPGEDMTPMCRTLLLADSGSGVSMALDPMTYISINVDLTVVLQRDPVGEWLMLDGLSTMGGTGTGLAETLLWDTQGVCGIGLQTLLVAPR